MKNNKQQHRLLKKCFQGIGNFFYHGVRPVFLVWIHDLRAIRNNIAALIIVTGLCLLPSLYAWINIYACWDPYANTGNLPVAIVNQDEGAVIGGKIVNVGDSIVEEMKTNKSMNWDFVDEWQGNYGLNEGRYYAMIQIPENFSERLTSLSTATPQKPVIVYRVNEKLNAIAAKITNVAKEKLAANIKANFVKTVNEEVIQTFNSETAKSKMEQVHIEDIRAGIVKAQSDIGRLKAHVNEENMNSAEFQKYLASTTALLPKVTEQIDALGNVVEASRSLNAKTNDTIQTLSTDLNNDMLQIQSLNKQNQALIAELKAINDNTLNKDVIQVMKQSVTICDSLHAIMDADIKTLYILNDKDKYSSLVYLTTSLRYADKLVMAQKSMLETLIPLKEADNSKVTKGNALDDLSKISDEVALKIQVLANAFYDNGLPTLNKMAQNMDTRLGNTGLVLESTKVIVPQLNALSSFLSVTSSLTVHQRTQLNALLTKLQTDVDLLLERMDSISGANLEHLIDVIKNNPTEVTDFLASPLEVKEQTVFEGGTFGVGLTPFYTVLAIWVGSLLLCAMLTAECEPTVFGIKLNMVQRHYGKMVLFLSLSMIQTVIITLGDVYLVGVKPENFPLLMGFALLSSVTFTVIIYTLVSLMGNVGKAAAVVVMVFQIAGSGGIYPIQTNPEIFGRLLTLWPFTYAINGMREAIAGPVWKSVAYNATAMGCFIAAFLVLALLKKPLHGMNMFFEHKFKEADL